MTLATLWSLLVAGLLAAVLGLGVAAARGTLDPNLHGMVGALAVGLAILSHVRRGSGRDFLAALLLAATAGLGTMAQAGSIGPALHLVVAAPAALLSAGLHLAGLVAAGREARASVAPLEETRQ